MAKDSPWFKFIPSEWNDGQISLCGYAAKGLFADLIALYWSREGDLSRDFALQKLSDSEIIWGELFARDIYSLDGGKIVIKFLDEQLIERAETSKKAKEAIAARWKKEKEKPSKQAKNTVVSEPYYDQNTTVKGSYYDPDTNKKEKEIREDKTSRPKGERSLSTSNGSKPPTGSPSPLWAVGMTGGSIVVETWGKYGAHLAGILPKISGDRKRLENAWLNYWPYELTASQVLEIRNLLAKADPEELADVVGSIAKYLSLVGEHGAKPGVVANFEGDPEEWVKTYFGWT